MTYSLCDACMNTYWFHTCWSNWLFSTLLGYKSWHS